MSGKSLSKIVIWQIVGKFALQGLSFFTAPIMTRLLTPTDYGYLSLYTTWQSIMWLLIGLDTFGAIGNARITYSEKEIPSYLSSSFSISLISFLVFLFISVPFAKPLSGVLGIREDLVVFLVFSSFANYTVNFYSAKLDAFKQAKVSTLMSLITSVLSAILGIFFVIRSPQEVRAVVNIYSRAIPTVILSFILIVYIYVKGRCFYRKEYWLFCFSLTLPILFHTVGQLVFSLSDRIMLQKMVGSEELGVYSIVFTLCNILTILFGCLNTSWVPFYYDYKKDASEESFYQIKVRSNRLIWLYTVISCGFLCLSPEVFKILAPENYWKGIELIPFFVFAFWFGFLYLFPVNHEFFNKKVKLIPVMTIFSALINILVNFIFIPKYGMFGAAAGTLVSYFVLFILHELAARFIVKSYEYKISFYIIPTLVVCVSCILFYPLQNLIFVRFIFAGILTIVQLFIFYKNKAII